MAEFLDLSNCGDLVICCQKCVRKVTESFTSGGDCTDGSFLNYINDFFRKSKQKAIKVDSTNQKSSASIEVKTVTCDACQQPFAESGVATVFDAECTGQLQSLGVMSSGPAVVGSTTPTCSPVHAYLIHGAYGRGGVGGVASVSLIGQPDTVHCFRFAGTGVEEYQAVSSILRRTRYVKGIGVLCRGLVFYKDQICLFIADCNNDQIHRIELGESGRNTVFNWPVGSSPEGLSITRAGNLLVTCNGLRQLQEYNPYGHVVGSIILPSNIHSPWHAVEQPVPSGGISKRRFVVSYDSQDGSSDCVCIVDEDRRIVCQYGDKDLPVGQLRNPRNLAVDSSGNVLVADSGNHRVVAMDPSLRHARELPLKGGLIDPWSLCLDESKSRLYVGEWSRRRIHVYMNVANISSLFCG